ncbi:MAG: L-ribulose-5-phosphate 4-epimerase [Clostridia bacterium]|nr:L-ribulose-5-phosphate 4-epimerase [Clostridia bacterium]MDR3644388.1 L-ribulose-5-phosphate 4-epimerase [Clostridia bacterium]
MLEKLKQEVYEANMLLPQYGLVLFTWGNVSGIDRESGLVVIKPSGVPYEELSPEKMVVVSPDGSAVDGGLSPSSDTPTHLALYAAFPGVGGITHTHSAWATTWAQGGRGIPAFGTTHADYFDGEIPCTRALTKAEIETDYEKNTGLVIIERMEGLDPLRMPAVLASAHGPFTWGKGAAASVETAVVLENVAQMAYGAALLKGSFEPMPEALLRRHFDRKHGPGAYYGQKR